MIKYIIGVSRSDSNMAPSDRRTAKGTSGANILTGCEDFTAELLGKLEEQISE